MSKKITGLTDQEVHKAQQKYGHNELAEQATTSLFQMFVSQFNNILILLLLAGSIISFAIGEIIDSILIVIIVIINALFGFVQEYKADNAIRSLKSMTVSKVRVIRNGIEKLINSTELVPGDIVKLEQGDKIPADATVLEAHRFEVNEASLTGESLPVEKKPNDPDSSTVFMGTIVSAGTGILEITATGTTTRIGSMALSLSQIENEDTPLMKKVNTLGKQLSAVAIVITIIIFFLGVSQARDYIEMVLISISLAVAAVPEGLPAVITITLTIGLQRMARRKAILRKLGSIEGLGNTTIIATDKTGTLTQNKMKVFRVWANDTIYSIEDTNKHKNNNTLALLIKAGVHCNNAAVVTGKQNGTFSIIGDQTEGSLLLLAKDIGISIDTLSQKGRLIDEFSFDQNKKLMSVVWQEDENDTYIYTKGAPEAILSRSTHILHKGTKSILSESKRTTIKNSFSTFANEGLRVLALAYRPVTNIPKSRGKAEQDLVFLGFVGIADPARKGLSAIIKSTKQAGIRTIMVTGDNPLTAQSVARHIGLLEEGDRVVTGVDIARMTDTELAGELPRIRIFARSTPEDKHRIVSLLQKQGEIVSVTGDGVNDALALKQADIGVAMGITGTDVAKDVADMIITDDNYASIVGAIREGRIIFDNIVKSIIYLVSCNFGELLTILGAMVISLFVDQQIETPLLTVHILWINLVTDSLPALSLAFDPGASRIMQSRTPVRDKKLINQKSIPFIVGVGIVSATITLLVYFAGLHYGSVATARALAFTTLVLIQLVVVFLVRHDQKLTSNKALLLSVLLSLILQFIVITVPPFSNIFVR